jgi:DNA-binding NarL/FixJ family response regulator
MIVDDFEPFQKMVRRALEIDGFVEIEAASDGEEAIALSREFRPDIVIMDHSLEGMNGLEATRAIKSELPDTAVIAVTGLTTPSLVFDYLNAGARSFVSKPVQLDHLLHLVRTAVPAW